jgi:DNA-binding CsgD family transcriptional regulator
MKIGGARIENHMGQTLTAASSTERSAARAQDLGNKLRQTFALTRSEASIAMLLAEGPSYAEIAARLGISYHTVHTHVKAIHRKVCVKSNGRLSALIRSMERG